MKKLIWYPTTQWRGLLGAAILVATSVGASASWYQVSPTVPDGSLNMRDGPGVNHALLGSIPAGTYVEAYTCRRRDDGIVGGQWCLVRYNGISGWASTAQMMPAQNVEQSSPGYAGPMPVEPVPPAPPTPSAPDQLLPGELRFSCIPPQRPERDPVVQINVGFVIDPVTKNVTEMSVLHATLSGVKYDV
jgi:uncharacterized protein YraI